MPTATDARIAVARSRFETARVILETWPGSVDAHTLTSGVTKTAKRGRHAWKRVRKDGNDEAIHAWRKAVKYLWYQAQLLEAADPQSVSPMVEDLDELSDLLGDEHDLTVLVEHLERSRDSEAMAEIDVRRSTATGWA